MKYFLSQPHQPFFILGFFNSIVMILVFALSYKGVLELNTSTLFLHSYTIIFTVFTNLFTGFLFTTFPRFCQTQVIEKDYYTKVFYLSLLGGLIFLVGLFSSTMVTQLGMFTIFISQLLVVKKLQEIYKNGSAIDKKDAFWILVAQYFGLVSHILFIISTFGLDIENLAIKIAFYLYIIFLTFSVGQRMIPFFSHSFAQKNEKFVVTVFILLILKTLFNSFDELTYIKIAEIVTDLALGIFILKEFLNWELKPLNSPAILWVLHLGLFWLPTAFFISAITLSLELFLDTSFYYLAIHILAIGFLTTILIGFGTRVTLGHSGQAPNADKFVTNLFWFIQVVVILRALFSVNVALGWNLNFLFDISFSAWLVLFLLWSYRYSKVLIFGTKL